MKTKNKERFFNQKNQEIKQEDTKITKSICPECNKEKVWKFFDEDNTELWLIPSAQTKKHHTIKCKTCGKTTDSVDNGYFPEDGEECAQCAKKNMKIMGIRKGKLYMNGAGLMRVNKVNGTNVELEYIKTFMKTPFKKCVLNLRKTCDMETWLTPLR